ncbi:MAG: hypothetical protein RMJ98_18725 [Myxococcales bacterium]|nr:hypothetical protein [Polyangiaceae bacterium]MDW8251335.1 hypothetical protein [Myxococcales bacterium]
MFEARVGLADEEGAAVVEFEGAGMAAVFVVAGEVGALEVLAGVTTGVAGAPPAGVPVAVAGVAAVEVPGWLLAGGAGGGGGLAGPRRGPERLLFEGELPGLLGPTPPVACPWITHPTASNAPATRAARYIDLMKMTPVLGDSRARRHV